MTMKKRKGVQPDFGPAGHCAVVYLWDTVIGLARGCAYGADCRNENITAEYSQFTPIEDFAACLPRTDELSIDEQDGHIWYIDENDGSTKELPMTPVFAHIATCRYVKERKADSTQKNQPSKGDADD